MRPIAWSSVIASTVPLVLVVPSALMASYFHCTGFAATSAGIGTPLFGFDTRQSGPPPRYRHIQIRTCYVMSDEWKRVSGLCGPAWSAQTAYLMISG